LPGEGAEQLKRPLALFQKAGLREKQVCGMSKARFASVDKEGSQGRSRDLNHRGSAKATTPTRPANRRPPMCGIVTADADQVSPDSRPASALVKENFWVFTPPCLASRTIFPDENSKSDTGASVIVFTPRAQVQHTLA
jgi:hypothetical protein